MPVPSNCSLLQCSKLELLTLTWQLGTSEGGKGWGVMGGESQGGQVQGIRPRSVCTSEWHLTCVAYRGTPTYQLPNTAAAPSNVALLQLTGTLPFTLEVAFLGGQSNWQKTIRGPVTVCGDCSSKSEAQPESVLDRAKALQGRAPSQHAKSHPKS